MGTIFSLYTKSGYAILNILINIINLAYYTKRRQKKVLKQFALNSCFISHLTKLCFTCYKKLNISQVNLLKYWIDTLEQFRAIFVDEYVTWVVATKKTFQKKWFPNRCLRRSDTSWPSCEKKNGRISNLIFVAKSTRRLHKWNI